MLFLPFLHIDQSTWDGAGIGNDALEKPWLEFENETFQFLVVTKELRTTLDAVSPARQMLPQSRVGFVFSCAIQPWPFAIL